MEPYNGCLKCGRVNVPVDHICNGEITYKPTVVIASSEKPEPAVRRKVAPIMDDWSNLFNKQ